MSFEYMVVGGKVHLANGLHEYSIVPNIGKDLPDAKPLGIGDIIRVDIIHRKDK